MRKPMTIIKEVLKNLFFSGKPIFRIDRERYSAKLYAEFPELIGVRDGTNLKFGKLSSDRSIMRQDRINVYGDLRKAIDKYKKEHNLSDGKGE
jgi:hypothetical protein